MKIVAILGSPHGPKGATGSLLAEVISGAKAAGAEVSLLSLTDYKVSPCFACDACHKTGTCPQKDGFSSIKAAMLEADGIVLASPNYIFSVSAQMKAVFDRCCSPLHCQAMRGKYALAVETSGGVGGPQVQEYIMGFERALGCWTVGSIGATAMELATPATCQQLFAAAGELGAAMVKAIRDKQEYPEQLPQREAFFNRMKALVQFRKDAWPYEYQLWKSNGWL
jgi:multimeric flavodoxin WrbA